MTLDDSLGEDTREIHNKNYPQWEYSTLDDALERIARNFVLRATCAKVQEATPTNKLQKDRSIITCRCPLREYNKIHSMKNPERVSISGGDLGRTT